MIAPTERMGNITIFLIFFAIGLFSILSSEAMPTAQFDVSGPGTFPTLLGIVLCAISAFSIVRSYLKIAGSPVEIGHKNAWQIMFATIALGMIIKYLGFIITIALFIFFLLKILSKISWPKCALFSVAGSVAAYLIFDTLIGIQLPACMVISLF